MTSPTPRPPMSPPLQSPIPEGLKLPDVIITRRTRTLSMNGRIEDDVHEGTVKFFCRSRGHGFIDDDKGSTPLFMHISDIDEEYIPRKGDRVRYQTCPMPPRFDKPQAVCIKIINFTPEVHRRWCEKETPEELAEDAEAIKEEAKMNESLKLKGSPEKISPRRRQSSGVFDTVHEDNNGGQD